MLQEQSAANLVEQMKWRYAVKKFDSNKKIPANEWSALEESLILTPSSYGMQPWKFFIIQKKELMEKLSAASYNQSQVKDCSHLLVIGVLKKMNEAYVDKYIHRMASVRNQALESLLKFKDMLVKDLVNGPRSHDLQGWASRQAYIALGNFMTSAALIGVDTCPLEGIQAAEYDKLLELQNSEYTTSVACAAGYRASDDKYSQSAKVRFKHEDVLVHI